LCPLALVVLAFTRAGLIDEARMEWKRLYAMDPAEANEIRPLIELSVRYLDD
jgi:hypothetical protein